MADPSSVDVALQPFAVLLEDQATIRIRGRQNNSCKYLLH